MGSLHPANRLAAYITGRVNLPAEISKKKSLKPDPANNTPAPLTKAAGTAVPSKTTTRTATEQKTPMQLPGKRGLRRKHRALNGFLLSGDRSNQLKNLPTLTPAATVDY